MIKKRRASSVILWIALSVIAVSLPNMSTAVFAGDSDSGDGTGGGSGQQEGDGTGGGSGGK